MDNYNFNKKILNSCTNKYFNFNYYLYYFRIIIIKNDFKFYYQYYNN